jgi:hypothetical protein
MSHAYYPAGQRSVACLLIGRNCWRELLLQCPDLVGAAASAGRPFAGAIWRMRHDGRYTT